MIDVSPWPGLRLLEQILEGNRNEVWIGQLGDQNVAVRRSRRSPASLQWELDLLAFLEQHDFVMPTIIPAADGRRSVDSVVVQRWIDGHAPATNNDWLRVASELRRLHWLTADYQQRPDCCTVRDLRELRRSVDADVDAMPAEAQARVLEVFDEYADAPISLIHGDPHPSNLRLTDTAVGFLDWDESRVDISWHDLSNLGIDVLDPSTHERAERLSNAWEAANGWIAEPEYAKQRLQKLDEPG